MSWRMSHSAVMALPCHEMRRLCLQSAPSLAEALDIPLPLTRDAIRYRAGQRAILATLTALLRGHIRMLPPDYR